MLGRPERREGVPGERGVVDLDVELEIAEQAELAQEADHGRGVIVVLMLGRFAGLRLDEELALEALGAGVVAGDGEEAREILALAFHVGVEERHVALASAPENIVLAAERDGGVDGRFELRARAGEEREFRVGRRAVHVARMAEEIGRAPEQFHAGGRLLFLGMANDGLKAFFGLGERGRLVNQVGVVETIIRRAELGDELEGRVHLVAGALHGIGGGEPRLGPCRRAERIGTIRAEAVPVGDREAQQPAQRTACDDALRVVITKGERVDALRAFIGDGADSGKILAAAGGEVRAHKSG